MKELKMGQPAFAESGASPMGRANRRVVALRAYATRENGSIVDMTIADLSYDGCGVICTAGLVPGEQISLSVVRRGIAVATVQWVDGAKAGLSFSNEPVEQTPAQTPRRHERVSVTGEVTMLREGRTSVSVHVFDLSPDGCKADFTEPPELNEQLFIKFDGIQTLEASARWIAGTKLGLKFARTLHPVVFDLLTARLGIA